MATHFNARRSRYTGTTKNITGTELTSVGSCGIAPKKSHKYMDKIKLRLQTVRAKFVKRSV